MNIQDYIESGILEAYILGSLTKEEEQQVVANIAQYPELRDELTMLEKALEQYAHKTAINPPVGTEDKIWAAIQIASGHSESDLKAHKVIEFKPQHSKPMQWKYAAIWIALIGSVAINVVLWQQGNNQKDERVALNAKMDTLKSAQGQLAQAVDNYRKANTMMADTGMQTIVMHTVVQGHPMAATLYWTKSKGEAYVAMNALPQPPKGMQYQLWVIQGGKPVSMGTLPNDMANTPEMQKVPMTVTAGEAFAISLEKEGGNPTPTTVYVVGKA